MTLKTTLMRKSHSAVPHAFDQIKDTLRQRHKKGYFSNFSLVTENNILAGFTFVVGLMFLAFMAAFPCLAMENMDSDSFRGVSKSTNKNWTDNRQKKEWSSSSPFPPIEHTTLLVNPQSPLFLKAYWGGIHFRLPKNDQSGEILTFMSKENVRPSFFPMESMTKEMLAISLMKWLKNNNNAHNLKGAAIRLHETLWQVFDCQQHMVGLLLLEQLTAKNSFFGESKSTFASHNVIANIIPIVPFPDFDKKFTKEMISAATSSLFQMTNAHFVYNNSHPRNTFLHQQLERSGFSKICDEEYENFRYQLQNDLGLEIEESVEFLLKK